jgi:hypothetical protein
MFLDQNMTCAYLSSPATLFLLGFALLAHV